MNTMRTSSARNSCANKMTYGVQTYIAPHKTIIPAIILLLSLFGRESFAQGVGISESAITPDATAILELRSTTRGFLLPRNTAVTTSAAGLTFYNTSTNRVNFYNGSAWLRIPAMEDNLSVFASTTSAQLAGVLSDETGSGSAVFATSPTLVTPILGVATATSINKVAITAPAISATLALADGSSLGTSGAFSTTLTTTGATNVTLPTSGTLATTGVLLSAKVLTTGRSYSLSSSSVKSIVVYIIGGGGAGGGCPNTNGASGAGGGSGGMCIKVYPNPAGPYTYGIGAAGVGASGGNGGAGTATTFDVMTAGGGGGGTVGSGTTGRPVVGGTGGTATGGDINLPGNVGEKGIRFVNTSGYGLAGIGGSTMFGSGGAGWASGASGNGSAGTGYGAGGGGSVGSTARAGGNGTIGAVIIFEYK